MKIVISIVIGIAVLIAAFFFVSCSICAGTSGMPAQSRAIIIGVALASLGVTIGGVYLIARINRTEEPIE